MPSPWQVRLALQVGAPAMQREYLRSLSAIAETASAAELRGCMERLVPYAPTPVLCEFARRSAMQAETPLVRAELARLLACCGDPLDEELFARPEIPSSTALIWHGARLARVDAQGVPPALVQRVEGYLWDALREPWNEREVIVAATGILNRARSEEATDALLSLADAFEDEREWLIGALALHPSSRARSAFDRYMRAMGRDPQLARADAMRERPTETWRAYEGRLTHLGFEVKEDPPLDVVDLATVMYPLMRSVWLEVGEVDEQRRFEVAAYAEGRRYALRTWITEGGFYGDLDALVGFFNSLARALGSEERVLKVRSGEYDIAAGPRSELLARIERGELSIDASRTEGPEPPPEVSGMGGAGERMLGHGDWLGVDREGRIALFLGAHVSGALVPEAWLDLAREFGPAQRFIRRLVAQRLADRLRARSEHRVVPGHWHVLVMAGGDIPEFADALDGDSPAFAHVVDDEQHEAPEILELVRDAVSVAPFADAPVDRLAHEHGAYIYVATGADERATHFRRAAVPEQPLFAHQLSDGDRAAWDFAEMPLSSRELVRRVPLPECFAEAEVIVVAQP